jgi:hypothetical protein
MAEMSYVVHRLLNGNNLDLIQTLPNLFPTTLHATNVMLKELSGCLDD